MFPLLFLLSALIGTFIAVDPLAASGKLFLIVFGLALSVIVPRLPERTQRILFAALPTIIAAYFLLTNDWAARIGKVPAFDPILRALAAVLPDAKSIALNSNVVGGIIATYLPLQLAALVRATNQVSQKRSDARNLVCSAGLIGLSLMVLLISLSRGAWIALAFVACAWLLHRGLQRALPPAKVLPVWMGLIAFIVIALGIALTTTAPGNRFLDLVSGYRGPIWRDSVYLAGDYAFTGIGLSNFEMVYSSYLLLVHVPFLYYAHNLFLDIWLGHGVLGLLAFGGWVAFAVRDAIQNQVLNRWNAAALASLAVILIHGLFDDPFYGYGAHVLPLLFVPLGLLTQPFATSEIRRDGAADYSHAGRLYMAGGAVAMAAAASVWFIPSLRASLYANLGAINQQRTELPGYTYQTWGVQDNLRRSNAINLQPAVALYKQALALDPANPTAHLRLGQIDLAHSRFEPACAHFLAAFNASPNNRAARQYVGECAALAGDTDKAIMLWRSIETGQGQLAVRYAWYNDFLADKPRAERISAVVQALSQ